VVNLIVPPLRDRREDIPLLAQHFLRHFAEKNRKNMKGLTPQAMDRLLRYDWPGNVRELMNVIERGVVLARSEFIDEEQLPLIPEAEGGRMSPKGNVSGDLSLDEVEKTTILNTLDSVGGNKSEAARRLGITRKTLHAKLRKYGFPSE
jgi:two-component system response regulator HydG